jgi:hypothetical protein
MRKLILGFALMLSGISQAATIDFDSQALGGFSSPLVIGDFQFFVSGAEIIEESPGDNALYYEGTGSTSPFGDDAGPLIISMKSTSGDPFAFYGTDIFGTSLNGVAEVWFYGLVSGGSHPLGPYAAGPVGTGDWLNLQEVRFEVYSSGVVGGFDTLSITVDNINANVVSIPAVTVEIDVDPFSEDNEILPDSNRRILVAILGTSIADGDSVDFDVTDIDPASLKFGPGEAPTPWWPWEISDVDGDGDIDDVAYGFSTAASGIGCSEEPDNSAEVTLTGMADGQPFIGTDTVYTSDCIASVCHP